MTLQKRQHSILEREKKMSFPVVVPFFKMLAYEIACHVIKNRSVVLYVARGVMSFVTLSRPR